MLSFINPTGDFSRGRDKFGSGQFNASRGNGNKSRKHQGLDIISRPGQNVKSPINGILNREATPYKDDPRFKGVLIKGTGEFDDLEIKIFYVQGLICGSIKQGDIIGIAQDLSVKYPGITNHIHLEVRRNGIVVSPNEFFEYCF